MKRREGFFIIQCPRCSRYTYAPTRQKTRLCVYCQRIFKINPLHAQYAEDAITAQTRVKLYQTGKHHKEFLEAVERSRAKVEKLIPPENIALKTLEEKEDTHSSISGKRRILDKILHENARGTPVDLHEIEELSEQAGLSWTWVAQQLEGLIRSGVLICPRPWQVRLIEEKPTSESKSDTRINPTRIARLIGEILQKAHEPLGYERLMEELDRNNIPQDQAEQALEELRLQGYILRRRDGKYQWLG